MPKTISPARARLRTRSMGDCPGLLTICTWRLPKYPLSMPTGSPIDSPEMGQSSIIETFGPPCAAAATMSTAAPSATTTDCTRDMRHLGFIESESTTPPLPVPSWLSKDRERSTWEAWSSLDYSSNRCTPGRGLVGLLPREPAQVSLKMSFNLSVQGGEIRSRVCDHVAGHRQRGRQLPPPRQISVDRLRVFRELDCGPRCHFRCDGEDLLLQALDPQQRVHDFQRAVARIGGTAAPYGAPRQETSGVQNRDDRIVPPRAIRPFDDDPELAAVDCDDFRISHNHLPVRRSAGAFHGSGSLPCGMTV